MFGFSKNFYLDLFERVLATYLQAFLGLLLVDSADITNLGFLKAAAIAAVPAALSVVKGFVGSLVGDPESASVVK